MLEKESVCYITKSLEILSPVQAVCTYSEPTEAHVTSSCSVLGYLVNKCMVYSVSLLWPIRVFKVTLAEGAGFRLQ